MPRIAFRPASITLDYLDLYGLQPSLERVRAAGIQPRVASPRVLKPGEERIADFLLSCDCPILVRSAGLLHAAARAAAAPATLIGDFSLNAANALSAAELLADGPGGAHPDARSERRAGGRPGARACGARADRGHRLPAPAGFPHRTLRLLPLSFHRHELPGLRPPVREAPRRAARLGRARASGDGRRGLPQYGVRRRSAAGRPGTWTPGARRASASSGWSSRTNRAKRWRKWRGRLRRSWPAG